MKKTARKEMAAEKYGRRQTGGGSAPPKPSETLEWLNSIMGESISGLAPVYDSDAFDTINLPASIDSTCNTEILEDNYKDCVTQNSLLSVAVDKESFSEDILKENISKNIDAVIYNFDTTTPKSMLRKPISKELVFTNKRKSAYTPVEARKHIIMHSNKKIDFLSLKQVREKELAKYAKEEHGQNMAFKKEAHDKAMKQQDEIHELEISYRSKMYNMILEKCKLETERAKLQLNSLSE